ncbi:MAG: hypothetical protein OER04_08565 [Cyclobacteriaceae bacterium]|nr:hypothetical protein [Cyclobacteriaceae bacterium]
MKPIKQLSLLVTILLLSIMGYGQEVHTITLSVATDQVENSNTHEVCNFGQDPGISNEEFTIFVALGDTVKWVGVSANAPDSDEVEITAINHEGGARVFGRNKLNDTDGIVIGVVTEGREGDEEKYKVSFKVHNNGVKRNGTFHIDPKIKVK